MEGYMTWHDKKAVTKGKPTELWDLPKGKSSKLKIIKTIIYRNFYIVARDIFLYLWSLSIGKTGRFFKSGSGSTLSVNH